MTTVTQSIPDTFLTAQPLIAAELPGYRRRPQQEALAAAAEEVLATAGTDEPGALMVEAGTGTGKSYGALIPAILHAVNNRGKGDLSRVIVVTTTIALMNQYVRKDLPLLEGIFAKHGITFSWAQLKSISHYACLSKIDQNPRVQNLLGLVEELKSNKGGEHTGDRDDIKTPLTPAEWRQVSSTSEECPGKSKCAMGEACFGQKAKQKATYSKIVVTNAAMALVDVKMRREMKANSPTGTAPSPIIGPRGAIIIDEAHELLKIATDNLGFEIRQGGVISYLDQAAAFVNVQSGFEEGADDLRDKIASQLRAIAAVLAEPLKKRDAKFPITADWVVEHIELFSGLADGLKLMHEKVKDTEIKRGTVGAQEDRRERLIAMGGNFLQHIVEVLIAEDHQVVRWAESYEIQSGGRYGGKEMRWTIKTAPIDVAGILKEELWDETPAMLMSATLATGTGPDRFGYLARALGLEKAKTLDVGTPFDFKNQALLYYPSATDPSPAKDAPEGWTSWMPDAMLQLVRAAGGGAMLLFSSGRSMRATHAAINDRLRADGIQTFLQDSDLTNKEIAERFRDDENSVLFGMKSFMVGMDFQGRTNRLVVVDKLPFAPPDDPITAARSKAIEDRGGDPFQELSVPEMTLTILQAVGRLIRTEDDYGVMAILDPRLGTKKKYGPKIVAALPPCPKVTDLAGVRAFFDARQNAPVA